MNMSWKTDITKSPAGFWAQISDMIDLIDIQLRTCDDGEYRMEFQFLKKGLKNIRDEFMELTHIPEDLLEKKLNELFQR